MRYAYSFVAWPDETQRPVGPVIQLFEMLKTRVEDVFTEKEFQAFRDYLKAERITLREIERVPYHEPENVP